MHRPVDKKPCDFYQSVKRKTHIMRQSIVAKYTQNSPQKKIFCNLLQGKADKFDYWYKENTAL